MREYDTMKKYLLELREELIDFSGTSNLESQELTKQFIRIKDTYPEVYELLVLIYGELRNTDNMNKKGTIRLLDKALLIKTETVHKMIHERSNYSSWTDKIKDAMTWQNTKRVMGSFFTFFVFIFILYEIDPIAVIEISQGIGNFMHIIYEKGLK